MNNLTSSTIEWNIKPKANAEIIDQLIAEIQNLHPVVAEILAQRGLQNFDSVRKFFRPNLDEIDEYGEMKDCDKAANRVKEALDKNQKILIYGDYDVDGTCSVSTCYQFLKSLNANVSFYIPDRYAEGYGVSSVGVDHALSEGFDLMITVDCGIRATSELGRAQTNGIDVIICDHHLPGNEIPEVFAILNPQQFDCPFRGKELCGCGVALMLLRALSRKTDQPELWKKYLDLTAIATCCDIVPLSGINRILVSAGIKQLNSRKSPGIEALLRRAKFSGHLNVADIVFKIGPRINAAGRLDHANTAVKLLISHDYDEAGALADIIEKLNSNRRTMDKNTTREAKLQLMELDPEFKRRSTVVQSEDWHKGIIGIVASRLIEFCYRPTIVLTRKDGILTGSARSVDGVHLYNALEACSVHLTKFGGHRAAAGLSLKVESLADFLDAFENAVNVETAGVRGIPTLDIDVQVDLANWYTDKYRSFLDQLNRCRPFGPTNMPPLFSTENCLAKYPKIVGQDHLKFTVFQKHDPKRTIPVIAFNMAHHYESMVDNNIFKIAYCIEETEWQGKKGIQLEAKDIVF